MCRSYLEHLPSADKVFRNLADSDRFSATSDMSRLGEVLNPKPQTLNPKPQTPNPKTIHNTR